MAFRRSSVRSRSAPPIFFHPHIFFHCLPDFMCIRARYRLPACHQQAVGGDLDFARRCRPSLLSGRPRCGWSNSGRRGCFPTRSQPGRRMAHDLREHPKTQRNALSAHARPRQRLHQLCRLIVLHGAKPSAAAGLRNIASACGRAPLVQSDLNTIVPSPINILLEDKPRLRIARNFSRCTSGDRK